jgi:hypothetical protein
MYQGSNRSILCLEVYGVSSALWSALLDPVALAIPYITPTNPVYMGCFANGTMCAAEFNQELGGLGLESD